MFNNVISKILLFFNKISNFLVLFSWVALYSSGIVVGTDQYRNVLNFMNASWMTKIESWTIVLLCYTMSNIAILCCLSAIIGRMCRESDHFSMTTYAARGLFVYLILVSGLLLLGANPFQDFTSGSYTRMAGTASLFSFVAGYSKSFFGNLTSRIETTVSKNEDDNEKKTKTEVK